jgi:tagatose 1,6-diphosphate aldolase
MKKLTVGKIRSLQQIASKDGIFTMCAMDHRGSLRRMLNEAEPDNIQYSDMVDRKLELCSALAEYTSAILLDPVFGAAQCVTQGLIPKSTGLLVSIEASGYTEQEEGRLTGLQSDWGVEKIKRMGASAVKLLLYYRPDIPQVTDHQLSIVKRIADECIKYDIPFLVEPKTYLTDSDTINKKEFAARKEELVIQTARDVTPLHIDVLKAEFPADMNYRTDKHELTKLCHRLDDASEVPWVILSAGVDFDTFYQQVEIACKAGASGYLGGRAIWQEAMHIDDKEERIHYLSTICVDRLKRLSELANKYAIPWYKKLNMVNDEVAGISENWYREY